MNDELSHVAQWLELVQRARNMGYTLNVGPGGFYLETPTGTRAYNSLFEVRGAISDRVAYERLNGLRHN